MEATPLFPNGGGKRAGERDWREPRFSGFEIKVIFAEDFKNPA